MLKVRTSNASSGTCLCARPVVPPFAALSTRSQCVHPSKNAAVVRFHGDLTQHFSEHRSLQLRKRVLTSAIALDGAHQEPSGDITAGLQETLILGMFFACWYIANIVFNIYNKEVLKLFSLPLTLSWVQFAVGAVLVNLFWATGVVKRPQIGKETLLRILPLAMVHTLGNLLTNISLGAVAVSFTHTIKAMEPAFSVALSAVFLGEQPHPLILLTLVPVMGGVALASMGEATFNWLGFGSAMLSNLTFQSRNVLSKKLMIKKASTQKLPTSNSTVDASNPNTAVTSAAAQEVGLDNINLFGVITCMSCMLLAPVMLILEGFQLHPAGMAAMGITNPSDVMFKALMAGVCFHTYQQVSYMILQRVSPVTHSIGNCIKRVVVIVASLLFFRNPITLQSATGTALALVGVACYSAAKRAVGKTKTKTE